METMPNGSSDPDHAARSDEPNNPSAGLYRRLEVLESMLEALVEHLPLDFWVRDRDERIVLQSAVCRQNWGPLVGTRPQDAEIDEATRQIWQANNRRAFAGELVLDDVSFEIEGEMRHFHNLIAPVRQGGRITGILGANIDITQRKQAEIERSQLIARLEEALARIKTLRGLIPICSRCKRIRDDRGQWHGFETYVQNHSNASFSHGLCPDCAAEAHRRIEAEQRRQKPDPESTEPDET